VYEKSQEVQEAAPAAPTEDLEKEKEEKKHKENTIATIIGIILASIEVSIIHIHIRKTRKRENIIRKLPSPKPQAAAPKMGLL